MRIKHARGLCLPHCELLLGERPAADPVPAAPCKRFHLFSVPRDVGSLGLTLGQTDNVVEKLDRSGLAERAGLKLGDALVELYIGEDAARYGHLVEACLLDVMPNKGRDHLLEHPLGCGGHLFTRPPHDVSVVGVVGAGDAGGMHAQEAGAHKAKSLAQVL